MIMGEARRGAKWVLADSGVGQSREGHSRRNRRRTRLGAMREGRVIARGLCGLDADRYLALFYSGAHGGVVVEGGQVKRCER